MKPSAAAGPVTDQAVRLRALVTALVRRFSLSERADVLCCGLTVAQSATLEVLSGGAMRLGLLARRLGITPSTLTRNLERLEQEGLLTREVDPEDSRAARVLLTPAGERTARKVSAQEQAFAAEILARLGAPRAEAVARALAELLQAVREATEGCCPGAFDHLMEGVAWEGSAPRRSRERKGCCVQ